jgi:hypothetical protein
LGLLLVNPHSAYGAGNTCKRHHTANFEQLDNGKDMAVGLGIGLATVDRIIRVTAEERGQMENRKKEPPLYFTLG